MSTKISEEVSRVKELESMFDRLSAPREVAVKEDVLRLGVNFSAKALEKAKGYRFKAYRQFSYDRVKIADMPQQEGLLVPEDFTIFDGMYGLRPTVIRSRIYPGSPYLIDVVEEDLKLFADGVEIADVSYPPKPKYYDKVFEDGTRYCDVAPLGGGGRNVFITAFTGCQFWGKGNEQCKFCDISENAKQKKELGTFTAATGAKKVQQAADATAEAFAELTEPETRLLMVIISGGAILSTFGGLTEDDFYMQYVSAIKEKIGNRWPLILQTVGKSEESLKRFRDVGVNGYHPNIEVWDARVFKNLCPGKERLVGRDEWIRRMIKGVEIFGEGNVNPNLVCGVEMAQPYGFKDVDSAVKSTYDGIKFMMKYGITPRLINWSVEWGSALAGHPPIPLEYFVRVDMGYHELKLKYSIPPVIGFGGRIGPGRSCVANSAYLDMGN